MHLIFFLALFLVDKEYVSITQNDVRMMSPSDSSAYVYGSFPSVCSSLDLSELAKAAKKKLQSVSIFSDSESLYWAPFSPFYLVSVIL